MKHCYLTSKEREFVSNVVTVDDWGPTSSKEIHRLCAAYCWELYEKWNGEDFSWVPIAYTKPLPLIRYQNV